MGAGANWAGTSGLPRYGMERSGNKIEIVDRVVRGRHDPMATATNLECANKIVEALNLTEAPVAARPRVFHKQRESRA